MEKAEAEVTTALTGTIDFFGAVELVAKKKKLSAKKAEAFLKEKLADGSLSLVGEFGFHLTPEQFAEKLASV